MKKKTWVKRNKKWKNNNSKKRDMKETRRRKRRRKKANICSGSEAFGAFGEKSPITSGR